VLPLHKILCPLDFSESSYKALNGAAEVASYFGAELVIVHVISTPVPGIPAASEEYERALWVNAEEHLSLAIQRLPKGLRPRTAIGTGDAADEIVRLAGAEAADLIVIATHGLTGWRHLIFGSVAEKIIRLADRPVLVVPAHESK
jgi:nucleotide-binding universal stress UspA family protein